MQRSVFGFSFVYEGKKYTPQNLEGKEIGSVSKDGITVTTETWALDSLLITREYRMFGEDGMYSLLWFENTGTKRSKILSDICDIDSPLGINPVEEIAPVQFCAYTNNTTKIYPTIGCSDPWSPSEFNSREDRINKDGNRYSCTGGRSSQVYAPFFEAHNGKNKGFLLALGWTGQWFAFFKKEGEDLNVCGGIENLSFYLKPGEKIRTASILCLNYKGSPGSGYNRFRRIVKDHFTPFGRKKSKGFVPLSLSSWGGCDPEFLINIAEKNKKDQLGFEYLWVDAGWYGDCEIIGTDAFTGDWWKYVGDWKANLRIHKNELRDVMTAAENTGLKPLLWIEPERAYNESDIITERSELFIRHPNKDDQRIPLGGRNSSLLDLSMEEGQRWMIDTVSHYIEDLHLGCYRQDFNFDPLEFWNSRDIPDRKGITQIKYIMGMYYVWDTLLEKHPGLIIDNCASGGRRIDLETLSRSVPLWRTDTYCWLNYNPSWAQNHNIGLSRFVPYMSCGMGLYADDKYRVRSAHAAGMSTDLLGNPAHLYSYDASKIKSLVEEFKSVRDYYSCDYYPIFGFPLDDTTWAGWQFHRSEDNTGIIMAFRRDKCLSDKITVFPDGISREKQYRFENSDTGEIFTASGKDLTETGLEICIPQKRDSRLFRYTEVN